MTTDNDNQGNQPAFPFVYGDQANPDDRGMCEGLTKREYFAVKAMQIYCHSYYTTDKKILAKASIELADEMLTQLNQQP